jgi:hypothetical protein
MPALPRKHHEHHQHPLRERLGQLHTHQRAGSIDNRAYQLLKQRNCACLMPVDLESLQRLTPEQVRELRCWSSAAGRETVVINEPSART